jgi:SAM-dependent methyltransferase
MADSQQPAATGQQPAATGQQLTANSQQPAAASMWQDGEAYEAYVGRWSRLVAGEFVPWLGVSPDGVWLDVGCGTGILTRVVLSEAAPREVMGVDRSVWFVGHARAQTADARARFATGDATALPIDAGACDAAVSGLVLNFLPDPARMVGEMARATRPGGTVGLYVWDYAGEMQMMRHFWDVAVALDPAARPLDEGVRSGALCRPEVLTSLFRDAGLSAVETRAIDAPTLFTDFADFWAPFLLAQTPAPLYVQSLPEADRAALREPLRERLPTGADGSIPLIARAWAVKALR